MARSAGFVAPNCLLFEECGRGAHAKGYCRRHYDRARKGALGEKWQVSRDMSILQRLEFHGWTVTESGCWEWSGRIGVGGYGQIDYGNKTLVSSRCAYEAWVGPIPEGMFVCHSCDNPPCINPAHLWLGTKGDNARDMVAKGRANRPFGEDNHNSKLTTDQVLEVKRRRATGETTYSIARDVGVSQPAISAICSGKTRVRG